MALSCKREAFKLDDGCPSLDVDLTFPDFESCEVAEPGRLKGVAKLDLQKSPAFPVAIPANDPLPVVIPDIDIDFDVPCVFDSYSAADSTLEILANGNKVPGATGKIELNYDDSTCMLTSIVAVVDLPLESFKHTISTDGFKTITFSGLGELVL